LHQEDLEPIGGGRDTDIGGDVAGGTDTDIGPSKQHGDAQDLRAVGDGQTVRTGRHPISKEDAENADVPREGIPEDLKFGKRRTVGLDEDAGAGMRDMSGIPDSTTGAG
jgi:hypothetical protein